MATRRATVRDRNRSAIVGTPTDPAAEPPAQADPPPAAVPARTSPAAAGAVWLSVYLRPEILEPAKAAYMADWMNHGLIDNFPAWIGQAIATHRTRGADERADIAARRPGKEKGSTGTSRTFKVDPRVIEDLKDGLKADRAAGRFPSDSEWVADALLQATDDARDRNGGTLPDPPRRLPNKMPPRD